MKVQYIFGRITILVDSHGRVRLRGVGAPKGKEPRPNVEAPECLACHDISLGVEVRYLTAC
jgi:hypothetical protein